MDALLLISGLLAAVGIGAVGLGYVRASSASGGAAAGGASAPPIETGELVGGAAESDRTASYANTPVGTDVPADMDIISILDEQMGEGAIASEDAVVNNISVQQAATYSGSSSFAIIGSSVYLTPAGLSYYQQYPQNADVNVTAWLNRNGYGAPAPSTTPAPTTTSSGVTFTPAIQAALAKSQQTPPPRNTGSTFTGGVLL